MILYILYEFRTFLNNKCLEIVGILYRKLKDYEKVELVYDR